MEGNLHDVAKPNERRRSDFVQGRRKSHGRSSCNKRGLDLSKFDTEVISPEDRLKLIILQSVKSSVHKVSEELALQKDENYLNVLVTVEESCSRIGERLGTSLLKSVLLQEIMPKENDNQDYEIASIKANIERLTNERCEWEAILTKERKRLASSQTTLARGSTATTSVPYTLEEKPEYEGLISSLAKSTALIPAKVESLRQLVSYHKECHSLAQDYLQDREEEIRQEFEESLKGGNVKDIIERLISNKYD